MNFVNEADLTTHARKRMRQRGIEEWEIFAVVRHGDFTERDGDIRVQIPPLEPGDSTDDISPRLLRLIVLLSADERRVVTAFWREAEDDPLAVHGHAIDPEPVFTLADKLRGQLEEFDNGDGEDGDAE